MIIDEVMTIAEAADRWNLAEGTLRAKTRTKKLIEDQDIRKSAKVWIITKEAMQRIYGPEPENK